MARTHGHKHHGGAENYGAESGGVSPRKAMAMGHKDSGAGGVEPYSEALGHMGHHGDHEAHTGMAEPLEDHERGIGHPIHHAKGHHPAQAAPDHGPHHPGHPHHDNPHGDHHRRHPKA